MKAPLPSNEAARLNALHEYEILDTDPEQAFDELTRLAALICRTPTALISLLDTDRQWFKSKVGMLVKQTPRNVSFCAYAILQPDLLIVQDAAADVRFADNPLVTTAPKIRFYTGAPLITPDGLVLGTLCVIDYVPREISPKQQQALKILARCVMTQLELRRNLAKLTAKEKSTQPVDSPTELQKRYALGDRDFKKAKLAGADLRDTNLKGADLHGANLKGANLSVADLQSANLKAADLQESDLRRANLNAADLKGANLSGAHLEFTMLQKASLQGANLRGANLSGAMLKNANLDKADLTLADFSDIYTIAHGSRGGTNLERASLKGANLKKANLKKANLKGANLGGANLKDSYAQGAYYDSQTQFPAGFDPVSAGMQKSSTSSSSSRFFAGALACVAIALAPVVIVYAWAEANKLKSTLTSTTDETSQIQVSFEANEPQQQPEVDVSVGTNKSKPALTKDIQTKTQVVEAAPSAGVNPAFVAGVASCPVLVRVLNAANPDNPSAIEVKVNGKKAIKNLPFSQASRYVSMSPGNLSIQFMKAGTKKMVAERTFAAAPNSAYTVAITGSGQGPPGQVLFNKSPFVIREDLSPPNPGKFKGRWYNLSETKAVIDLKIAKSGAPDVDEARLVDLLPKTGVDYPELNAGTYNFNPVLPNKSDPLVNSAYKPPIRVEIAKANIPSGTIFDVFAIGNTLNKGHNSLKLSAAIYRPLPPTADGCTRIN